MKKILICFIVLFNFLAPQVSGAKEPLDVRVVLLKDAKEVLISVTGPVQIFEGSSKRLLYSNKKGLSRSKIVLGESGCFRIGQLAFKADSIRFTATQKAAISVNKRSYRGTILLCKSEQAGFLVINILDVESYVRGVLNQEISHKWPLEALKAQAVAARTYALYQRQVSSAKKYDVTADTSSQMYGGYLSERRKTNRAINTTYGEVLTYQDRIFETFFCATCGGVTEDAGQLWNVNVVPLRGQRVCPFCCDSPHFQWNFKSDLMSIEKKLAGYSKDKKDLMDIAVFERNKTGRVQFLELVYKRGGSLKISAKDFRALMDSNSIRSTNFFIERKDDDVVFQGKGWGHGVGLCQHGALGMAKKGYSYRQILEFYYPGAKVMKIY
ncbi:MAG: SpoIID/LytB domain-containing protein [Candidatus Omnitrophota bacterium]